MLPGFLCLDQAFGATLVEILVDLISCNVFRLASEPIAHFLQSSLFDHVFKKMLVYMMTNITLSGKINIFLSQKRNYV